MPIQKKFEERIDNAIMVGKFSTLLSARINHQTENHKGKVGLETYTGPEGLTEHSIHQQKNTHSSQMHTELSQQRAYERAQSKSANLRRLKSGQVSFLNTKV